MTNINFLIVLTGYFLLIVGLLTTVWGAYAFTSWAKKKIIMRRRFEERTLSQQNFAYQLSDATRK